MCTVYGSHGIARKNTAAPPGIVTMVFYFTLAVGGIYCITLNSVVMYACHGRLCVLIFLFKGG